MRTLMTGATGRNAGLVLPELKSRDVTVRALVRDQAKARAALGAGADETALADLRDPASLEQAMTSVDSVFHLNPAFAPDEADLGLNMVRAAQRAGVKKFVFSGAYHPSLSLTNHAAKRPVEEALYGADLTFVVLQPAMFMQNLAGLAAAARTGVITMPYATTSKMTYVDFRDVAEVAAIALTTGRLDNGTYELAAPEMVTNDHIAALFAEHLGMPVRAERLDPERWVEQAGLPAGPMREGLLKMNTEYDQHGFHGGNDLVLRTILDRAPRSLSAFIRELVNRT